MENKEIRKYVKGYYTLNTVPGLTVVFALLIVFTLIYLFVTGNTALYLTLAALLLLSFYVRTVSLVKISSILNKSCDAVTYLEATKELLDYGRSHKTKSLKDTLNTTSESMYIFALTANWKFCEALDFLKNDAVSIKKNNPDMERFLEAHTSFLIAKENGDIEEMKRTYSEAKETKFFKRMESDNVFEVNILMVEEKYEQALELLNGSPTPKYLSGIVADSYLKGVVCMKLGKNEEARKYLDFAVKSGNTMPLVKKAEELLETLE